MTLAEILELPEGKTLEYKRDLSSPDGVLKALVAFGNTAGGVLVIGVEDRTKRVTGLKNILGEEERLASFIADCIKPRMIPDIDIVPWRRTHVLIVRVASSQAKPHYVERLGFEKGVFVRVGSTNRRADAAQVQEMQRFTGLEAFDEQPIPDLDSEAIDFRVASELFAPIRKLTPSAFHTLRITTRYQGKERPTIGGLLLFGRDRFRYYPDAWIQAGRFAGKDRSRIIDSAAIRNYLPMAAQDGIAFIQKHMMRGAIIGTVKRVDRWTVPPVALREALINAIVHTDYAQRGAPIRIAIFDDRIEIENPGLLLLGLTVDDIKNGLSRLRNRVIGRVFDELKLIEGWGSGIQRMMAACEDAGLPAPVLEELGSRFRVTFLTKKTGPAKVDPKDQGIVRLLRNGKGFTTSRIAESIGLSSRATRTRLLALIDRGLVYEVGSGPQDPKRQYFLVRNR
jgi:ATP-dependent DNA helicase RecG